MSSHPTISGADESLPLFNSGKSNAFYYRVAYSVRNILHSIQYNSVHELILNLCCFKDHDTITYVSRDYGSDFMTITVDQFKVTISESIYSTTHDNLERLYLRLLLTNQYSRFISDRGRFRQFDFTLRKYLTTIKGGVDSYLSYESRKVILYLKYRRLSTNHLLAKIIEWNDQHDIHINHINIPTTLANQDYFEETLRLHLRKAQIRLYNYDPIPEAENDKVIETESEIASALLQVFNQLLK